MYKEYKYNNSFSNKLAVLCSDERFIRPSIEFMDQSLGITTSDLVIIPGGPEPIASKNNEIIKRIELLVETHNIKEIILITHEDCGYYKKLFKKDHVDLISEKQIEDLGKATQILNELFPDTGISCYFCKIKDRESVCFETFISSIRRNQDEI